MNRNTLAVLIACALLCSSVRSLEAATCGNGIREPGEQCDDGNNTNLDGCSAQCTFEQSQRINQFKMQFTTLPTLCSANAFGAAIKDATQTNLQGSIDTAVSDGRISVIFHMLALDDLSGTTDAALAVGVLNGTPAAAPGVTYNGNSDLDWWYTIDPNGLGANRIPLSPLNGSIAASVLTAGPGNAMLPFTFGGAPTLLRMSSLRLSASNGASSTPLTSTGFTPPGHLAAEHLDPALTSYGSSGAGTAGELCGNVSAASLAQVPVPAALQSGGIVACVEGYSVVNTMLDVLVGGCRIAAGLVTAIAKTQPDQQDASVPPAGAGGLYVLSAPANHHVDTCKDKNGATVDLNTCLNAAAYSSFFKFSTDRVIAGRRTPPAITQINPNAGPTNGSQSVTITGTDLDGAKVKVDTTDATVNTTSAGSVTFLTPAHAAATVDVIVSTDGGGSTTAAGGYTYVAAPAAPTGVTAAALSNTRVDVGWIAVSGANSYEVDRQAPGGVTTIGTATNALSDTGVVAGTAYLYRVRAVNAGGKSLNSAPALATTLFMANDPLTSTTPIRAIHLAQLRTAVNAVRTLASLPPASTTDSAVANTVIKAVHVTELRLALDAARGPLGLSTGGYTDSPLTGVRVKAIHFQELRTAAGTTPLPPVPTAMVVNELSTGAVSSASDEFIELFNNSNNTAVELSDWKVVYRAAAGVSDTTLVTIPQGTTIQPGAFYLLGGAGYTGAGIADQSFTSGLSAVGGAVGIRNPAGTLIDSVGWGTATNALVEGTAAAAPPPGSGIDRLPDGVDTNNNATDFKVNATLTPRAPNQ